MSASSLAISVFVLGAIVLIILVELGLRSGRRALGEREGLSTSDGAIFALVGLLLAFCFSGAMTRLERRHSALVDEANSIGTAYLRIDLLEPRLQPEARSVAREYLKERLSGTQSLPDHDRAEGHWERSHKLGLKWWELGVKGTETSDPGSRQLVLDSLNQLIDLASVREISMKTHVPWPVVLLLAILTSLASVIAGNAMAQVKQLTLFHRIILPLVFAAVLAILADIEFPRMGWVRLGVADQALASVQEQMDMHEAELRPQSGR